MKNISKYFIITLLTVLLACQETNRVPAFANLVDGDDLVQYVNPLMGTDSKFDLSNGNTYPAIATPWGMNFWTPMTSKMGDGWTYKYRENKIRGIKQTHQPSPWLNDYAAFSLMAVTGELKFQEDERESWFSHKAETSAPHYYSVYLADYDAKVEVSPTDRAAHFRFTFPETEEAYIMVDAFAKGSMVKILPEERKIIGYSRYNHGGVPENFHNYWVAEFDKDFEINHAWADGWKLKQGSTGEEGDHVGAIIGFKTQRGEQVHVKVASSFISPEQAQRNLDQEIGSDDFETTKTKSWTAWQNELIRIQIEDDNLDNARTFYSCLYRLLLFPRKFYELDAEGKIVHYSPYNGEVLPGYMFTDNGFWDTFRAVFPFFALMYPELDAQIMDGLANTYKESGWLPEWASPGHRGVMIGSNSAINIADAYIKGVRGFDIETLYEAVVKNATTAEGRPTDDNGNVIGSVGREGVDYYNSLGYVPYDVGINENAARTLEYAFADFNISELARLLDKPEDVALYRQRSLNYKNLFDPETGWMRGKNEDGNFQSPFNPLKWGDAFTEGNSLHYTWSVFHDIDGLAALMGGKKAFGEKLDEVFTMPPVFDHSYYGFTIHEIREMQIVNMGNYAHGNQPIQHMIYLYNHAGQPWKAQDKVREVMDKLYSATPDGYCGDEDNGQTSAWYVFSSLGFYPVTPGVTEYVMGSPLFKRARMTMPNGKEFVIEAPNNTADTRYINGVKLNGSSYSKTWLDHADLQAGGKLELDMSTEPNMKRGTAVTDMPYSMSSAEPVKAAYGGGIMYKEKDRAAVVEELKTSGLNTIIVWTIHINEKGDLNFNAEFPLVVDGKYVGHEAHPNFAHDIAALKTAPSTINRVEFGLSAWESKTFDHLKRFHETEGFGPGTTIYENFKALKEAIPDIDAFNNDDEVTYDVESAVAFTKMLAKMGYQNAIVPYKEQEFWSALVEQVNAEFPGNIDRNYLQCYAGGKRNDPCASEWDFGIPMIPGLWAGPNGEPASEISKKLQDWNNSCELGGGFLWDYEKIALSPEVKKNVQAISIK